MQVRQARNVLMRFMLAFVLWICIGIQTADASESIVVKRDRNEDGQIDYWAVYVDNRFYEVALDRDDDGIIDAIWKPWADGSLVLVDRNVDGYVDVWARYNADGNPMEDAVDRDRDGTIDVYRRYLETSFEVEADTLGDGQVDVWAQYSREGWMIHAQRDMDHDGEPDWEMDTLGTGDSGAWEAVEE